MNDVDFNHSHIYDIINLESVPSTSVVPCSPFILVFHFYDFIFTIKILKQSHFSRRKRNQHPPLPLVLPGAPHRDDRWERRFASIRGKARAFDTLRDVRCANESCFRLLPCIKPECIRIHPLADRGGREA